MDRSVLQTLSDDQKRRARMVAIRAAVWRAAVVYAGYGALYVRVTALSTIPALHIPAPVDFPIIVHVIIWGLATFNAVNDGITTGRIAFWDEAFQMHTAMTSNWPAER